MKNESYVTLSNGHTVHSAFFNCIKIAVEEKIPTLPLHAKLTLKKICGKPFWEMLDEGEQVSAGWCMTHLVTTNQVPMLFAGKDCHNANLYQRA